MDEDLEWNENMASMEFHPCDTPRGMLYYNMDILTKGQQRKLNSLKIKTLKENQKYLAHHPEIQACVSLITKVVLKQRPRVNIHETIAEYFSKSRLDIEADVNEYLKAHKPAMYEGRSHLDMFGHRSQMSSSESSSYTSSSTRLSSHTKDESLIWKMDIPDIDVGELPVDMSGSLMNISVEYELGNMETETPLASMSTLTPATDDEEGQADENKPKTSAKPQHITISEYLKELESMSYLDMLEGEMDHIPGLEDYDGGYERRRHEDGEIPMDENDGPITEYMAKMPDATEEDKHEDVVDLPKASLTNLEPSASEMKALMSRQSVRVSVDVAGDLKRLEMQMEENKTSKRRSKEEGRSQEERERRVRPSLDEEAGGGSDDRSNKQKTRVEKTTDQLNKLHLDYDANKEEGNEDAGVVESADQQSISENREEEVSRKGTDQNIAIKSTRAARVSIPEEHVTEVKRYSREGAKEERTGSISEYKETGSIESTIRHQFDTTFKSVGHVKADEPKDSKEEGAGSISEYKESGSIESTIRHQFDTTFKSGGYVKGDEPKSKSSIYFKPDNRTISTGSVSTDIACSLRESGHSRSKLEQKVSFGVATGAVDEEKNIPID